MAKATHKPIKKMQPKSRGKGRPAQFKPEYCEQAEKLCKLGATDKEIADFFGVSETSINNWKLRYSEFVESLKRGKMIADANVVDKLFNRAMGYSHESEKIFNNEGMITRAPFIEHYPPDVTACIFWLKNRQPKKWRDKIEQGFTNGDGEDVNPVTIFQLPDNGRSKDNQTAGRVPRKGAKQ